MCVWLLFIHELSACRIMRLLNNIFMAVLKSASISLIIHNLPMYGLSFLEAYSGAILSYIEGEAVMKRDRYHG